LPHSTSAIKTGRKFFMLEIFGRSMFFAAAAMNLVIIWLLAHPEVRREFALDARVIEIATT
jgi:hypothetical protein